jgi:outer membrane protein OmpA-like peptidoglycan-associated protein
MKKSTLILLVLAPLLAYAQVPAPAIQWAADVQYQYNGAGDLAPFSARQALGAPDAFPPGVLSARAFRLEGLAAFGTLVLTFEQPKHANQLVIVESNHPGRVVSVDLIDVAGLYHPVYRSEAVRLHHDFRTLVLSMPRTDFLVKAVSINLNSVSAPGDCQIDAVGMLDNATLSDVRQLLRGANYNIQPAFSFTSKKEPLSDAINSRFAETKPLVSYDGHSLYFSRMYHPANVGGRDDAQDIYYAVKAGGQWMSAENLGAPLNDALANGVCAISPDGNSLLVINGYQSDGTVVPGVSISQRIQNQWSSPQAIHIRDFENLSQYQDFYLSADENTILMAVERPTGFGEQDLYVSHRIGSNSYSTPINLGPSVNTTKGDFAPFLSPDNTTLFFASEGHQGYGQSDIYRTRRLDNSWQRWSEPENLGPAVNTAHWEAYFSITAAGDYAYFVSSEGSHNGSENIYRIGLLHHSQPPVPDAALALQGKVLDAVTGQPLAAAVTLTDARAFKTHALKSDELTGNFLTYIAPTSELTLGAEAPGYVGATEKIDAGAVSSGQAIYRELYLMPLQAVAQAGFDHLSFERGKPLLLQESLPTLDKLIELLKKDPDLHIVLEGHTDAYGSQGAKLELSEERVERIKAYLVASGVESARIEAKGYGGTRPIAPNDTEENRARNRRVEIRITDTGSRAGLN